MIPIFAVIAGAGVAFLWQWAFRDAREERLKAEVTAARAGEARAEKALDRVVARGTAKRGARFKD